MALCRAALPQWREARESWATDLLAVEAVESRMEALVLAELLPVSTSLKSLNLYDNNIGHVGAKAMADALRVCVNASLTEVCILPLYSPLSLHHPSYSLLAFLAVESRSQPALWRLGRRGR